MKCGTLSLFSNYSTLHCSFFSHLFLHVVHTIEANTRHMKTCYSQELRTMNHELKEIKVKSPIPQTQKNKTEAYLINEAWKDTTTLAFSAFVRTGAVLDIRELQAGVEGHLEETHGLYLFKQTFFLRLLFLCLFSMFLLLFLPGHKH